MEDRAPHLRKNVDVARRNGLLGVKVLVTQYEGARRNDLSGLMVEVRRLARKKLTPPWVVSSVLGGRCKSGGCLVLRGEFLDMQIGVNSG